MDPNAIEVQLELENEHVSCSLSPQEIEEISNDTDKYVAKFYEIKNKEYASTSASEERKKRWDIKEAKLLATLRFEKEKEFNQPKCKKIKLWQDISNSMKEHNYNNSVEECQQKYRNLLQTFKQNKEKQKKTGESKITWELFDMFDRHLGEKPSIIPPNNLLSSNINYEIEETENSEASDIDKENVPERKEIKKTISFNRYLYEKNCRQLEKEKNEKKRWEEKKKLQEKEIEAINNLADAIRASVTQSSQRKE